MNIIDLITGRKRLLSEDGFISQYIKSLNTDEINLEGPFITERHALKYSDLYKTLLKKTFYKMNLSINRQIPVISSDHTLCTQDNGRMKLGISPFNHSFGIFLTVSDFTVISIDGNILLNRKDSDQAKRVIYKYPITVEEEAKRQRFY